MTTRWSVVLAAGGPESPDARSALAVLCETYWRPVFEFVRQHGRSADEARDLTQAFFARVLEKGDFKNVRRERGRFRNFLLAAVRHFLSNQADFHHALRRGGGRPHLSIDGWPEERTPAKVDPPSHETPETIFERRWALDSLDAALRQLAGECEEPSRKRVFEQLRPMLTGDDNASYAEAADVLGMTEPALRVALHRLRRQFGRCLRDTLAQTVDDPADVDSELRHLLRVIERPVAVSSLKHV